MAINAIDDHFADDYVILSIIFSLHLNRLQCYQNEHLINEFALKQVTVDFKLIEIYDRTYTINALCVVIFITTSPFNLTYSIVQRYF